MKFTLSVGDLWCYGGKPFQTVVRLGDQVLSRLIFERDRQQHEVAFRVEPRSASQRLLIESSASFVPAQIDRNSRDQRRLAVKMANLLVVDSHPGSAKVAQEN